VTKGALGGRATPWAITRVKPEQASKVKSRMPTRLNDGEGWAVRIWHVLTNETEYAYARPAFTAMKLRKALSRLALLENTGRQGLAATIGLRRSVTGERGRPVQAVIDGLGHFTFRGDPIALFAQPGFKCDDERRTRRLFRGLPRTRSASRQLDAARNMDWNQRPVVAVLDLYRRCLFV
jgi:hypothetical protein